MSESRPDDDCVPDCQHKDHCAQCWGEYARMAHEIERLRGLLQEARTDAYVGHSRWRLLRDRLLWLSAQSSVEIGRFERIRDDGTAAYAYMIGWFDENMTGKSTVSMYFDLGEAIDAVMQESGDG